MTGLLEIEAFCSSASFFILIIRKFCAAVCQFGLFAQDTVLKVCMCAHARALVKQMK